jgi:hypothetical protein
MTSFRLALALGGLGGLALGLSSCLKEPEYPNTPSISFNSIQDIRIPPKVAGAQALDSIRLTINYQDGDGDLGLTEDERKSPPYDFQKGTNRFYNNFFIEPFIKNPRTGKFEPLTSVGVPSPGVYVAGQYNGAFPHPTTDTDSKAAPIKGTLTYAPIAFGLGDVFVAGQTVRFEITIADRALNLSNTITTDSIVIRPR